MKKVCVSALMLLSCLTTWSQASTKVYDFVLINASIVDVKGDSILPNKLLAIDSGVIRVIDNTSKESEYQARNRVDLQNQFVMPGLWDMHVHFLSDTLIEENKAVLPLFLAHGVTAVREAGSDIFASVRQWQQQIRKGAMDGPRIFTSGLRIDGPGLPWGGFLKVATRADITKALDTLQALGVDVVKVCEAEISRTAYLETISQAARRGMRTSGHLPLLVPAHEAVNKGLRAFEHLDFALVNSALKIDSIRMIAQYNRDRHKRTFLMPIYRMAYDSWSPQLFSTLVSLLAEKHVAVIPTLITYQNVIAGLTAIDHTADTMLNYISPKIVRTYRQRIEVRKHTTDTTLFGQTMALFLRMIPEMQRGSVLLLAGTDCAPSMSFVYPGQSLHDELKLMVQAGLTPAQALQTATCNSAKFMNVDKVYGSIDIGKQSDMVVLATNPLFDINALDHIRMVMANGKMYTREELDKLMRQIRQKQ